MSDISQYLAAINSAIYGKDVRGAIHDAIETTWEEIENEKNYSIVKNIEEAKETTTDYVLVVNNDGEYGDGGPCLFEKMSYTVGGYVRDDETRIYPVI